MNKLLSISWKMKLKECSYNKALCRAAISLCFIAAGIWLGILTGILSIFINIDYLKFFLPLAGAAFVWYWNEREKRLSEEYQRKEAKYVALIESLEGFYEKTSDAGLKNKFLEELNKCWLYCPDEVIKKGYAFLETVQTGANSSDDIKEQALGQLVLSIRKDLLCRKLVRSTHLKPEDFQLLKVNDDVA